MTAVVCTRNRGATVADAVRSILANDHPDFELIVVDQSTNDGTESALAELLGDSRLRYVRSLDRGLSNARNLGLRRAQSGKIAMTDDDCTVPVDWLTRMEKALDDSEGVAIVIGNVVTAEYDRSRGFVPSYAQKSSFLATTVRDKHRIEGMAACMGLCADACKKLSGFDPSLGAGSRFHSADETDMIIRALLAGYKVLETPEVEVTHFGLRSWSEAESIVHNYLYGIGATIAKHVKIGNWSIAHVALALAGRWTFAQPAMDYGFRPGRRVRLMGFLSGFKAGMLTRVDKRTGHFASPERVEWNATPV
ncbi:MAG TPA: glycosyltransferase [Gemmatimonadaceae bacterium]|nr:glycosyltransferase [Gemmatimonadaceae bacterium]